MSSEYSVCVIGLWHLGCITASGLSSLNINVTAFDEDNIIIENLKKALPPIEEPNLREFIKNGLNKKKLKFTDKTKDLAGHDFYWFTYDTPVDENDNADFEYVVNKILSLNDSLKSEAAIILSSQVPVGTCELIKKNFKNKFNKDINLFYSPENLRLGNSFEVFLNPDRIIIGFDEEIKKINVKKLFDLISTNQIWMTNKSAEMAKHAINCFLASSVVFANEIASICEGVGANPYHVSKALKSDKRIGKYAYLNPGGPFSGGTLARDVNFLSNISSKNQISIPLIASIIDSNNNHKKWILKSINNDFKKVQNLNIVILGLAYKNGTNTLRRSHSLEIANWLDINNNTINLYDPNIKNDLDINSAKIKLKHSLNDICEKVDLIIITRGWKNQAQEIQNLISLFKAKVFIYDINRNLFKNINLLEKEKFNYRAVGFYI